MRVHHRISAVTLMVVAATGLAGCSGKPSAPSAAQTSVPMSSAPPEQTSASAPSTAPARPQTWTALQAGDCLADLPPTDPAVVTVTVVDCAGPHRAEAFLSAKIPVDAALNDVADSKCRTGFATYTGTSPEAGGFTISYLIDSDQDRTSNNPLPSTVICILQSAQNQYLTGSARH